MLCLRSSARKAAGGDAVFAVARYAAPVSTGVTCRLWIAICRTALTVSAMRLTVEPSGKMISSVTGVAAGAAAAENSATSSATTIPQRLTGPR